MCGIRVGRVEIFAKFTSSFLNRNHLFGKELFYAKNIKEKATKADMEELVAYKRKEKCDENNCVHDTNTQLSEKRLAL